jgi:ATP-dependent Clp protease ATP-binding subunit ClpC
MSHFTTRARGAVALGLQAARAGGAPYVGTEHLLAGVLAEGGNLALEVLRAMEIEPDAVRRDLARAAASRRAVDGAVDAIAQARREAQQSAQEPGEAPEPGEAQEPGLRFSGPVANALELAVTEAIGLGHNYVGCEHLLLGLVSEPEGTAGEVLRGLGAEYRPTRRAISAALLGYTYIQAQKGTQAQPAQPGMAQMLAEAIRREIQPFAERLERLEQRLGPTTD